MSAPTEKMLLVFEAISLLKPPFSFKELQVHTQISNGTLSRMINTLIEKGYLTRDGRKLTPMFTFQKSSIFGMPLKKVYSLLENMVKGGAVAAEIIFPKDDQLLWIEKSENEKNSQRILAYKGMTRSIYEYDVLTRVYLRTVPFEKIKTNFFINQFYPAHQRQLRFSEINLMNDLKSKEILSVDFDKYPNGNGVKRYALNVFDSFNRYHFILSIAEPDLPIFQTNEHQQKMIELIKHSRNLILTIIK